MLLLLDMLAQISHSHIIDEQTEVDNKANCRQALEESVLCYNNNGETTWHCVAQYPLHEKMIAICWQQRKSCPGSTLC